MKSENKQETPTNPDTWQIHPDYEYEDNDINALLSLQGSLLQPTQPNTLYDVLGAMNSIHPEQVSLMLSARLTQLPKGYQQYHLLIPYNLGNYHWVGVVVKLNQAFQLMKAFYCDSLSSIPTIPKTLSQELQKVGPQLTLTMVDLFKQSDKKACGVCMIDNLIEIIHPQHLVTFPYQLSAEEIRTKRKTHLKLLHDYHPVYFADFYPRQRENRPSVLAIPEQLQLLGQAVKFSLPEWQRLLKLEKLLMQLSPSIQTTLKEAFIEKNYADDVHQHLQAIKTGFNTMLSDASLSRQDKKILYSVINLLFSLELSEEINLTDLSDLDWTISHEELRAVERLLQIQHDAAYALQLQKKEYYSVHSKALSSKEVMRPNALAASSIEKTLSSPSSIEVPDIAELSDQKDHMEGGYRSPISFPARSLGSEILSQPSLPTLLSPQTSPSNLEETPPSLPFEFSTDSTPTQKFTEKTVEAPSQLSSETIEKLLKQCSLTLQYLQKFSEENITISLRDKLEELGKGAVKQIIGFSGQARDINYSNIIGQLVVYVQQVSSTVSLDKEVLESILHHALFTRRSKEYLTDDALYISVWGADSRLIGAREFKVQEEVETFLASPVSEKVLLLLGESGLGKTMFCQHLARTLAEYYDKKTSDVIPLYIWLPHSHALEGRLIEDHLEKYGFQAEQIAHLKHTRKFVFILDSYDEIRGSHAHLRNLCVHNELGTWNAKVLIACRTTHLLQTHSSHYTPFFVPFEKEYPQKLKEINLLPFKEYQIADYIAQYLKVRKPELTRKRLHAKWHKAETYFCSSPSQYEGEDYIHKIPHLISLIQTPFLLKVTMDILPGMAERALQELQQGVWYQATRDALLEKFIAQWFLRQLGKLIIAKELVSQQTLDDFNVFSERLAVYMEHHQRVTFNYVEAIQQFCERKSPLGQQDFSKLPTNPDYAPIIFKGIPLQKVSETEYTFLHVDIQDYFYTRAQKREHQALKNLSYLFAETPLPSVHYQRNIHHRVT